MAGANPQGHFRARNRPCGRVNGAGDTAGGMPVDEQHTTDLPAPPNHLQPILGPGAGCWTAACGDDGTADQPPSGPKGASSHAPPANPWQSRNQSVDPVSLLDLLCQPLKNRCEWRQVRWTFGAMSPTDKLGLARPAGSNVRPPQHPQMVQNGHDHMTYKYSNRQIRY
jgi:hypothetical protein